MHPIAQKPVVCATRESASIRMKTVLIIDDHPRFLQTLMWLLEAKGYRCVTASTSTEAERVFCQESVDVVIVDHGLPGVDGLTLAGLLKAIRRVPVLMLSGNPDLKPQAGAVDRFLLKPQSPEELLAAMQELTSAV